MKKVLLLSLLLLASFILTAQSRRSSQKLIHKHQVERKLYNQKHSNKAKYKGNRPVTLRSLFKRNRAISFDGESTAYEIWQNKRKRQFRSASVEFCGTIEKNSGTYAGQYGQEQTYLGGTILSIYSCEQKANDSFPSPDIFLLTHDNAALIFTYRVGALKGKVEILRFPVEDAFFGERHHIVLTLDSRSNRVLLFVDGAILGDEKIAATGDFEGGKVFLGVHPVCVFDSDSITIKESNAIYFKGEMNRVRFFRKALPERRVKRMYNGCLGHDKTEEGCEAHEGEKDSESKPVKTYEELAKSISIYPNPSYGTFYLSADPVFDGAKVRVVDGCGWTVFESTFCRQMNLRHLRRGQYRIVLIADQKVFSRILYIK